MQEKEFASAGKGEAPVLEPARQYYYIDRCRELLAADNKRLGRKKTCTVRVQGCQMNEKDGERLLGILKEIGYEETDDENADFVLYNTCTVRENANLKVYGHLGYLQNLKKKNPDMVIALCGCMMQEPHVVEKIKKSYRFVDIVFGTHNIYKLAELIYENRHHKGMVVDIEDSTDLVVEDLPSKRKYPFKSGVNIMFGCNNFCSYCIVPYVRGRERSRKPEDILDEVRRLAADGVIEIMLLGQNVNSYGKTLEQPMTFAALLREVEKIDGIERIRFMTSHPKDLSDELIEVMASSKKICRQFHLPLQSGSSRILREMNRHYTKEQYLTLVEKLRGAMPDIHISTDIIVGFPGETEEDFEETLDVVKKARYDSAYTFIYSKRTGTPAAKLESVPENIVKNRFSRLLAVISDISECRTQEEVGKVKEVLFEEVNAKDASMITGRLDNNMVVHAKGSGELIGKILPVKLVSAKGFYYYGEIQAEAE